LFPLSEKGSPPPAGGSFFGPSGDLPHRPRRVQSRHVSRPVLSRPNLSRPNLSHVRCCVRALWGAGDPFPPIEKKIPTPPGIFFPRRGSFPRRASRVPSQLPVRRERNHYPVGNVCSRVLGAARAFTVRIDPRDPRTADSLNSGTSDRGAKSHFFLFSVGAGGSCGQAPNGATLR